MEYRGLEFYATEVPVEFIPNAQPSPVPDGRVFVCEIYEEGDDDLENLLSAFFLVEGIDFPARGEDALISALRFYIDQNFLRLAELVAMAEDARDLEAALLDAQRRCAGDRVQEQSASELCR